MNRKLKVFTQNDVKCEGSWKYTLHSMIWNPWHHEAPEQSTCHQSPEQSTNEWVLLDDSIDDGYLSPEEDGKIIENNENQIKFGNLNNDVETKMFLNSDDEIDDKMANSILESEFIPKDQENFDTSVESKIINSTKKIVKKVPRSIWINIALQIFKMTNCSYDWRISLTYSLVSTTILMIKNRIIILKITKFTLYNGLPFIFKTTSGLKSYYFKKT